MSLECTKNTSGFKKKRKRRFKDVENFTPGPRSFAHLGPAPIVNDGLAASEVKGSRVARYHNYHEAGSLETTAVTKQGW